VKPVCKVASHTRLHRHHKAHPKIWFGVFLKRAGEPRFQELIKRYNEFRPEDTVLICDWHHCEIHAIYDEIIAKDRRRTGVRLAKYRWGQAERLMRDLTKACDDWLKKRTPGLDPALFEEARTMHKALLRKRPGYTV
jgi:hypothetical protein